MQNRKALLVLGVALGVPLLLAVGVDFASGIGPEASQYESRLKTARSLDFDPGFRTRLARDAAKPQRARWAFEELQTMLKNPGVFRFADPKQPAPKGQKDLSDAEVRQNLKRAADLARRAEGGGHRKWEEGVNLLFPDLAQVKGAAKAADTLAREAAAKGDYKGATDALLDAADIWRAYLDEPILITDLVRTACMAILFRTAGCLLADPAYPPDQAERLFRMAEGPDFAQTIPPRDFLATETGWGQMVLENPPQEEPMFGSGSSGSAFEFAMKLKRVRRAWASDGLRLYIDAARALPSDPYDFDRSARAWQGLETAAAIPRGLRGKFSEMMFPVFDHWIEASRNREAQRRVLRLAAGLRAGRSEASLRTGFMALDPADGNPLRIKSGAKAPAWLALRSSTLLYYESKREAPILPVAPKLTAAYALGRDGKDDGGIAVPKPDAPGDEVLVIPAK